MKITKQLIKKFEYPIIDVRVINGLFKSAEAKLIYSNGWEYKIIVERVHPMLKDYCSCNDKPVMLWPESKNSWIVLDVPEELQWVADNLYEDAETPYTEALKMQGSMREAIMEYYKEMK